jgi:NhaA family Na+:H+ antiporter
MIKKVILKPFQSFVNIEALSGLLLFGATLIALLWANSSYAYVYTDLWKQEIGFQFLNFELKKSLLLWINDGLMAVFFFLIGLEIKRELTIGELNTMKKAGVPIFAALGGMLFPLSFFLILNNNPSTQSGWAIPMATDIAFSLAIIKMLGKRIPLSLKIFLTAFAIVDDLGAVLIIAVFYSSQLNIILLVYALIIVSILFFVSSRKLYNKYLFFLGGVIVWFLFLKSGIHPTIAGVLMAFTIPVKTKINTDRFTDVLPKVAEKFKTANNPKEVILSNEQIEYLNELESCVEKVQSPLQHLEHNLHNWVAYFIMPLFAFANAGISIYSEVPLHKPLIVTLIISLVAGNALGVSIMVFLGRAFKLITLPHDVNNWQILGLAFLAGVGFTMSIFITNLAYSDPAFIDSAKTGIIIGSSIAGILGYLVLRFASANK